MFIILCGGLMGGLLGCVPCALNLKWGANMFVVSMQNRGVVLIFHPIAIATCAAMGANPVGLMILIQTACLSAFMTPMATSAISYIMDYGGYDQKSMIKQSLLLSVICCVVSVGWIMTVFPYHIVFAPKYRLFFGVSTIEGAYQSLLCSLSKKQLLLFFAFAIKPAAQTG